MKGIRRTIVLVKICLVMVLLMLENLEEEGLRLEE
jgi:hypothetical protein